MINLLLWRTINSFHPVIPDWVISKLFLAIGDPCTESNSTVQTFSHTPNHTFQMFQMSFVWHGTETTKRHHRVSNMKLSQHDQPLSGTNQHLKMFNTIRTKQGSIIQLRFVILVQRRMYFLGLLSEQLACVSTRCLM